jgi:TolB protein
MRRTLAPILLFSQLLLSMAAVAAAPGQPAIGIFERDQDVGTVLNPGSAQYDPEHQSYTVSGSGDNMWFGEDDFHFVWKKIDDVSDLSLTATIAFAGTTGNDHRKAVLMFRQSLDAGSPYVDIARHGDGLTSLQFRDVLNADTHEVESSLSGPTTMRIEKRGDSFYAFVSAKDGKLEPAGTATKLTLTAPFYVGIGVCAHDKNVTERAVFTDVRLHDLSPATGRTILYSALETISVESTDRRVAWVAPARLESPNWSRDGSNLLFNQEGEIYRLPLSGAEPTLLSTAPEGDCNRNHGISPDGQLLAETCRMPGKEYRVFVQSLEGGSPKPITQDGPSYWSGWSQDGKTLFISRETGGSYAIYSIPATGGKETRLISTTSLDSGSDESGDGESIFFSADRTGWMQIWRMKADGSNAEQMLADDMNDWFPHVSPDGKWLAFLSYEKQVTYEKQVKGDPEDADVVLKLMSIADGKVRTLAALLGGEGTMNSPSWSPDSRRLAFVSYEFIPEEDLR